MLLLHLRSIQQSREHLTSEDYNQRRGSKQLSVAVFLSAWPPPASQMHVWQYHKWHALLHLRRSNHALASSSLSCERNSNVECMMHSVESPDMHVVNHVSLFPPSPPFSAGAICARGGGTLGEIAPASRLLAHPIPSHPRRSLPSPASLLIQPRFSRRRQHLRPPVAPSISTCLSFLQHHKTPPHSVSRRDLVSRVHRLAY